MAHSVGIRSLGRIRERSMADHKERALAWSQRILWYGLAFVEVLLGFRLLLKVAGANPGAGFTNFVYSLSGPLARPFLDTFGTARTPEPLPGSIVEGVFEWSTLIALFVYPIFAWGVVEFVRLFMVESSEETKRRHQSHS